MSIIFNINFAYLHFISYLIDSHTFGHIRTLFVDLCPNRNYHQIMDYTKSETIKEILRKGKGLTVEYKSCTSGLNNSVFETVCSFSNRYGGYILLGVNDNGRILGVNHNAVQSIKGNFINVLNNPNKINPSLYLELSELEIDGKTILWVYVPVSSDVIFCDGKVFDRVGESDQDITRSVNRVANLYSRKSSQFSERKIFPYVTEDHLRLDLIPLVKQLASVKRDNHPWTKMSPMELFRSSGLYEDNLETGQKGFNLAAILLFGKDEVIRSCLPAYCTDAIFRNTNQDRYDDRQIVSTNLIEAYDILMDFTRKHTDDRFFLEDGLSIGVRDIIAREVISNLIVHREYSSAFPAKLVIDKNKLYTENWNKALTFGKLDPETFTPYPKNPLIASFFLNINRADILGSGVRNLFKYTKVYSGGEPVLEEGDIFKTTIPLSRPLYTERRNPRERTLAYLEINDGAKTSDIADYLGYKSKTSVLRILSDLMEDGLVVSEGAGKNTGYSVKKGSSRFLRGLSSDSRD